MATGRRLGAGLAASLALHLALLDLAPPPPGPGAWPTPPPLRVELVSGRKADRMPAAPVTRRPSRAAPAVVVTATPAPPPPAGENGQARQRRDFTETVAPAPPMPAAAMPPARLDLAALYAAARAQARQDSPPPWLAPPPVEDRPILPALAHALRREAAGERRLADGLVRVVAADGRAYCLLAPPGMARGGPVDPLAVPVTCP